MFKSIKQMAYAAEGIMINKKKHCYKSTLISEKETNFFKQIQLT